MKKILFITPQGSEYGFSLAGAAQRIATAKETLESIKKAKDEFDIGLLVVDERLLKGMEEEEVNDLQKGWEGILFVLPAPVRPEEEIVDYARALIQRTIGYHLRLNP